MLQIYETNASVGGHKKKKKKKKASSPAVEVQFPPHSIGLLFPTLSGCCTSTLERIRKEVAMVCVCVYQVKSDSVYPVWHPASSLGRLQLIEWAKLSWLHSYRATGTRSQALYKTNSHTHKRHCHSNMRLETLRYLFGIQASSWVLVPDFIFPCQRSKGRLSISP